MKAAIHGGMLALALAVLTSPIRADFIGVVEYQLYPQLASGSPTPNQLSFGASSTFGINPTNDPLAVALTLNGPSVTTTIDASSPGFAALVTELTNGSNPWLHLAITNGTGSADPGSVVATAQGFLYGGGVPGTGAKTPGPVDLAGATISDIKLTVSGFVQHNNIPPTDWYGLNAKVTFDGTPGPFQPNIAHNMTMPTPEPGSLALAGLGALGLLGFARRRCR